MAPKKPQMDGNPEHEEKKRGFIESGVAKKEKKSEKAPPYLLAMLLILGLLAGVALSITFLKPSEPIIPNDNNSTINDSGYKTVSVTVVYSKECKSCRDTTTIEELFKVRQIAYTMKKVDANSAQGKQIIAKFGIDMLPAAIVDAQKIAYYPTTKAAFDTGVGLGLFRKVGAEYAISEQNWAADFYFPVYYVNPVTGTYTDSKPSVMQFDDYYAPEFTKGRAVLYSFIQDFNNSVDIKYSFTETAASHDYNATLGNLFLMCASTQSKYIELERSITGIYCNNPFKGDPLELTGPEINGCSTLSAHYGTPLSQTELDLAAGRAKLDTNALKGCYDNRQFFYTQAQKLAKDLQISRNGIFLIDGRETASLAHLRESLCAIHPQIAACAGSDINASQ